MFLAFSLLLVKLRKNIRPEDEEAEPVEEEDDDDNDNKERKKISDIQ